MLRIALKKENIYQGNLILINKICALRDEPGEADLTSVFGNPKMQLCTEAASALQELLNEFRMTCQIVGVSAYRKKEEQTAIFEESLKENGRTFTETYVAFPNHSEHQTGLAIDLAKWQEQIDFIRPEFPYEGIFGEFRKLAPYYGFIERYQKGKECITGIGAEPWHFRYVGIPHACIMTENDLVLEEYMEWIRSYDIQKNPYKCKVHGQEIRVGYLPYVSSRHSLFESSLELPYNGYAKVSGNNRDGFIITIFEAVKEQVQRDEQPYEEPA